MRVTCTGQEIDREYDVFESLTGYGSATLMRGSVSDLPKAILLSSRVSDPSQMVIDRRDRNSAFGKSETCRASEWQSHSLAKIGTLTP
jgi:hypothetical protein